MNPRRPLQRAHGRRPAQQAWMCCVDDRRQLHAAGVLPDGRAVVQLGDFPDTTSPEDAATAPDAAATAALTAAG